MNEKKRRVVKSVQNAFNILKKEIKANIETMLILFVIWIVLFEEITPFVLISGIILSVGVIVFTDQFLLIYGNYEDRYMLNVGQIIRYALVLLIEIFSAGWSVIPNIVKGESDVAIITVVTDLKDEFLVDMLANSVTLTPGTVTVEKNGSELRILSLESEGLDEDPHQVLPLKVEKLLLKFEEEQKGNKEGR